MTKEQTFKYLKDNKKVLIEEKKAAVKHCDPVVYQITPKVTKEGAEKSLEDIAPGVEVSTILVKAVINTTNIIDSHKDCHQNSIWKKCLKEKKDFYLLQEHQMKFNMIITDKVKAFTEAMTWKDLGLSYEGTTEALIFDCEIDEDRNEYMFEQYLKGYVKNHSVGMRYISIFLCINSDEKYYAEEKANWDKYYPTVANKEVADQDGYFWAVTEAKIVEGSAVPIGSNTATPTLSVSPKDTEADDVTSDKAEPPTGTPNKQESPDIDWQQVIDKF